MQILGIKLGLEHVLVAILALIVLITLIRRWLCPREEVDTEAAYLLEFLSEPDMEPEERFDWYHDDDTPYTHDEKVALVERAHRLASRLTKE